MTVTPINATMPLETDLPEPVATDTLAPADTPSPTNTPEPTKTPEPTASPTPASTPLSFNETLLFADWSYQVSESSVISQVGENVARGSFVAALVQITNNSPTAREVGSEFFLARDAQGRTYQMDSEASLEYYQNYGISNWHLDEISPSGNAVIPVVFDVSPDATEVTMFASGTTEPEILLTNAVGGEAIVLPGEVFSAADWSYSVGENMTISSIGESVARGEYVAILLAVKNDGDTTRTLGTEFFRLEDGEGRVYPMDSDASLEYYQSFDTDAWFLEDIGPSLDGIIPVVFDVSPDATALAIVDSTGKNDGVPVLDALGGDPLRLEGDVYPAGTWEFTVSKTEKLSSIGDYVPDGTIYVTLLQVKNLSHTAQELGSSVFKLKDAQGRMYDMDTDASLEYYQSFNTDAWHLESIGPSLIGTIPVAFDVPDDIGEVVLLTPDGDEISLP